MELVLNKVNTQSRDLHPEKRSNKRFKSPFIEANTKEVTVQHLTNDTILPVFSKDNEVTISHAEFVNATKNAIEQVFPLQEYEESNIRVSHIVKGRIPTAIGKSVKELLDTEKTIYYERMAFCIEIPSITKNINGNELSLVVGGVRAFNNENLYSKKSYEKFRVFIGFVNAVCTNLCVATDGFKDELKVLNVNDLQFGIETLFREYNQEKHLGNMKRLSGFYLSMEQVAHLVGKMKMYQYLSASEKDNLFPLNLNDSQINTIAKNYFKDENFNVSPEGVISLWQLYNLFTGAVKSSYIDSFLQRELRAYEFIQELANSIQNEKPNFFLH
ncbi:DUF3871 family protein [Tenacibaculum retecalamus]|uniref:DUF3871 family protein n=1 Tax=Tenacibaculum retecalamus TaxID=3018315 RepID=UPI0023D95E5C|nr:DUF3871 family protein [Tenacibaculum retecalamus]WBX72010.1 DUF3871 family protein [Tenacibaculum retecalamus]